MRLCLFTPTFLPQVGGAERDADVIVRGLIQRGHEVAVLARGMGGEEPDLPYPVYRYTRPPAQHLWPELLSRALRRVHRRWPFECVLAFYGYPNGYAAMRIKKSLGVAVVATPRGGDLYPNYHELRKPRVPRLIAEGYRGSDRIVSISHWLTERLHEVCGEGLPPIDLVYNGIDLDAHDRERDASRAAPPNPPLIEKPFALHIARVAPVKQQTLAVEAVARIAEEFRKRRLKYAIVGEGEAVPQVKALIQSHGLEDIVQCLGTRTGLEKAWLYDNARFMVSSSREEGLGNVVLEAMASGLPMLGSDIGPHRELIGQRGWGLLFRSGDAADMAAKLIDIMDADLDPWINRAMLERENFTLDAMVRGYEAACQTALEHSRS